MGRTTQTRILPGIRQFALAGVLTIGAALAAPAESLSVQTRYYDVSARTLPGLRDEMQRKGPGGFWAYTRWNVRWTAACDVSVEIHYTLPRHRDLDRLTPAHRRKWLDMLAALDAHERQHGGFGIAAAREVERARCSNARDIVRKWARQDAVLDRQTDHGTRRGVVLR